MLKYGSTIALVACSNGQMPEKKEHILNLVKSLEMLGWRTVVSPYLFKKEGEWSATAKERARVLMQYYEDPKIEAIFDVSGGDLAAELLAYLDFKKIRRHPKAFFGYSDLTTLLNAIYAKTGESTYLYQIRNIVGKVAQDQQKAVKESLQEGKETLYKISYQWIQQTHLEGEVIGGNIRCFLKLAGTPYLPSFQDKILFLESLGGESALMSSYLHQLKYMGAFEKISGILLGTFSKMQGSSCVPSIETLVTQIVCNPAMPIAKTEQIGHGEDSKAIIIGKKIIL